MNFIDRPALGDMLALRLQQFHGKDAVILCLQESSLLTCITVASKIRAWIYPLVYEPVYTPDHAHKLLGAFNQEGDFCSLPDALERPEAETAKTEGGKAGAGTHGHGKAGTHKHHQGKAAEGEKDEPKDDAGDKAEPAKPETGKPRLLPGLEDIIEDQRKEAMKSIDATASSYGITLDKHQMDGRDVILAADILTSPLPLLVAQQLLKDVSPASLTAAIGNTTPDVAQLVRLSTGQAEIMDILSGIVFDEGHYFEQPDTYTVEQKHTLTQHVAAYWQ